ncbi:helix-turn-helix domain-containing protein [Streptomyces sp. NPDC005077]|uniref:helix-turn-helix domain-containing protein n=1 Tax=Streptomyces sp. NPDC005077 TaxID=3154292 RepID=UPI0033A10C65
MKDLAVRLDALDPQAGAALRVIAYFDDLLAHGAGLEAIVRGATILSSCPAALIDDARRVSVRVDASGRRTTPAPRPDPAWPTIHVSPDGPVFWLEYDGAPRPADAMVLERASAAASAVLQQTRGRSAGFGEDQKPALVEVLLDGSSSPEARHTAAHKLGLAGSSDVRAVAVYGGGPRIVREAGSSCNPTDTLSGLRAGIGPAGAVDDLPSSWTVARRALRLTAEGTPDDPGPRSVRAEEAGALLVLALAVGPDTPVIDDVTALERTTRSAPWMLATLDTVATGSSRRAAASLLHVHHSTLQERLAHAERELGWSLSDAPGRFRLHLALVLRRLHRNPL